MRLAPAARIMVTGAFLIGSGIMLLDPGDSSRFKFGLAGVATRAHFAAR